MLREKFSTKYRLSLPRFFMCAKLVGTSTCNFSIGILFNGDLLCVDFNCNNFLMYGQLSFGAIGSPYKIL